MGAGPHPGQLRDFMKRKKWIFWLSLITFVVVFIFLIKSILLPFVIGILAAYFLDPAADRLEKYGFSRTMSTVIITVLFFGVLITTLVLLSPLVYEQVYSFITKIPEFYRHFIAEVPSSVKKLLALSGNEDVVNNPDGLLKKSSSYITNYSSDILSRVWQSSMAIVNTASLIFITPIVTFYLLRDWDRIVAKIDSLLPRKNINTIRLQVRLMDEAIAGFVRGQANVCVIMAVAYAIGLMSVGLEFGLVIGLATGILAFIPYIGFFVGFMTAVMVAVFQFQDYMSVVYVVGVLLIGQAIESNFITPKLVGDKVGLHPVWLIFGMLSGAAMLGAVGVFIAVPLTAMIAVLIRFAISRYKLSTYYKG